MNLPEVQLHSLHLSSGFPDAATSLVLALQEKALLRPSQCSSEAEASDQPVDAKQPDRQSSLEILILPFISMLGDPAVSSESPLWRSLICGLLQALSVCLHPDAHIMLVNVALVCNPPSLILCSLDIPFHLSRTTQNLESLRGGLDTFPAAHALFVSSLCLNQNTWCMDPPRVPVNSNVYHGPSAMPLSCFLSGFDGDLVYPRNCPHYVTQQPQPESHFSHPESADEQDYNLHAQVHSSRASNVKKEPDGSASDANEQDLGSSYFSDNELNWESWNDIGVWHMRLPPDTIVIDNDLSGTSRTLPFLVASDSLSLIPVMTSALYHRYVWCIDAPLVGVELNATSSCLKVYIGWLESQGDQPVGHKFCPTMELLLLF